MLRKSLLNLNEEEHGGGVGLRGFIALNKFKKYYPIFFLECNVKFIKDI